MFSDALLELSESFVVDIKYSNICLVEQMNEMNEWLNGWLVGWLADWLTQTFV